MAVPPAPAKPSPENYHVVLDRLEHPDPAYTVDTSMPGHLNRLIERGIDAYLFTRFSAIPLADYVRGFYVGRGIEIPLLTHVAVGRTRGFTSNEERAEQIQQEAARLRPIIGSMHTFGLVDEYVESGATIWRCCDAIRTASDKEADISSIRGRYYHRTPTDEVDLGAMTSIHRDFFFEAGQRGASLNTQAQFARN